MPGTEPLDILLHSTDPAQCLDALRYLKNQIIGSNHRKVRYVQQGIVPILLRALEPQVPADFQVQAAVTLGSLAYGPPDVVSELFQHTVEDALLVALAHPDIQVVESAARSLKILYKAQHSQQRAPLKEATVRQLVVLMTSQHGSVSELAAGILARGCGSPSCQEMVVREGGLGALLRLLQSKSGKGVESALDAIAALTSNNAGVAGELVALSPGLVDHLFDLCKDERSNIRLLATTCVANMAAARVLDTHGNTVEMTIVPSLVKLCSDPDLEVRARAHVVLAGLVESSESLSKAASEADAMVKLQDGLTNATYPEPMRTRLLEGALLAIAALCAVREANRKLAQELGFIPHLKSCLEHPGAPVRIAACKCILSLSRSVRSLRTNLVDNDIAAGVTAQLSDQDVAVQIAATAALCNLLLDFSPLKKACLDEGAVQRLSSFFHSPDVDLRRAAVFSVKNLLYLSDAATKARVAELLGWGSLVHVLRDPDPFVQQHALGIVRNMTSGGAGNDIIDAVLSGTRGELLPVLVAHLNNMGNLATLTEAMYVVVNMATGDQIHADAILADAELMRAVERCLTHNDPSLRVASVWAIINLAWADAPGATQRVATLRRAGIDTVLGRLTGDADLDVRDRARTALQQFSKCSL